MSMDIFKVETELAVANARVEFFETMVNYFSPSNNDSMVYVELDSDNWKRFEEAVKDKWGSELKALKKSLELSEDKSATFIME